MSHGRTPQTLPDVDSAILDDLYPLAVDGIGMCFYAPSESDNAQRSHRHGRVHHEVELRMIREHLPPDSVILDVGANIGNHAIFFARCCRARSVSIFEPNPAAIAILAVNVRINDLDGIIDDRFLGLGVGAASGTAELIEVAGNLGVTRLRPAADGTVDVVALDDLDFAEAPTFIKIDVEGMEMDVLHGGADLIRASRPLMYVEVHELNYERFDEFVMDLGYRVVSSYARFPYNRNVLIAPGE